MAHALYEKFIVQESFAEFNKLDFFRDEVFYEGIYKNVQAVLELDKEHVLKDKTIYFNRSELMNYRDLVIDDILKDEKAQPGVAYKSLLYKTLYWELFPVAGNNTMPTSYTSLDPDDETFEDRFLPVHMSFLFDGPTLQSVTDLFDLDNKTIAYQILSNLKQIPRLKCFDNTFTVIEMLESKSWQ